MHLLTTVSVSKPDAISPSVRVSSAAGGSKTCCSTYLAGVFLRTAFWLGGHTTIEEA
jgi:hypothetical protein